MQSFPAWNPLSLFQGCFDWSYYVVSLLRWLKVCIPQCFFVFFLTDFFYAFLWKMGFQGYLWTELQIVLQMALLKELMLLNLLEVKEDIEGQKHLFLD